MNTEVSPLQPVTLSPAAFSISLAAATVRSKPLRATVHSQIYEVILYLVFLCKEVTLNLCQKNTVFCNHSSNKFLAVFPKRLARFCQRFCICSPHNPCN